MPGSDDPPALCVLGCRVGSKALVRRAKAAASAYGTVGASVVVACGGRSWEGLVESDELARMMRAAGVPEEAIVRERCSLDTRDNARFAAALLERRGISRLLLVTCAWHLPRAKRLFEAAGFAVEGLGVEPPDATLLQRGYWHAREALASWKDMRRPMRIV